MTAPSAAHEMRRPRLSARRLSAIASHGYIWLCLAVFVMPFIALIFHSLSQRAGVPRAAWPTTATHWGPSATAWRGASRSPA